MNKCMMLLNYLMLLAMVYDCNDVIFVTNSYLFKE